MEMKKTRKRRQEECYGDGSGERVGIGVYDFRVLLPNGLTTKVSLRDPGAEVNVEDFVRAVRVEFQKMPFSAREEKRKIVWDENMFLEDMSDRRFKKKIPVNLFQPNQCHILRLCDGSGDAVTTFQNLWDLTPDTDLLTELPEEYTFVSALADLIDNSLQAIWFNGPGEQRLIKVEIGQKHISVFDSGPGMDGSENNSIARWGKMGSSNHRLSRMMGIGGKPPFLMPFFGMFGYGGLIASMHLGRRITVNSKTKDSKKVYTLFFERELLLNKSHRESVWRADGSIRDPLDGELKAASHGSFTKVVIFQPKMQIPENFKLQCMLKDIYFPYIQFEEDDSVKKRAFIEFQVNGTNLADVEGGEVAITNLYSCNGSEFVLQLSFSTIQEFTTSGNRVSRKAHAQLRCVYFPIVEGKENISRILEGLEEGCGIRENFEEFCRVSIRRLGRLLPDARWVHLRS